MKTKNCLALILFAGTVWGMDGVEFLNGFGFADTVTVTSTNLVVVMTNSHPYATAWGLTVLGKERQYRTLEPGEEILLTPSQAVHFGSRDLRIAITPVSFTNKHKGFRVTRWWIGSGAARKPDPEIVYVALCDAPMAVGEDDVELTMDDGEWVKPGDSRSLEIEKLGWDAEKMIQHSEAIMRNPERMADVLRHRDSGKLWNTLVEKGLIKQETQENEKTPLIAEMEVVAEKGSAIIQPKGKTFKDTSLVITPERVELRGRHIESGEQNTNVMVSPPVTVPEAKQSTFRIYAVFATLVVAIGCGAVYVWRRKGKT